MKTDDLITLLVTSNAAATAGWERQRRLLPLLFLGAFGAMGLVFAATVGLRNDLGAAFVPVARKEAVTLLALVSGAVALWHLARPDVHRRRDWMVPAIATLAFVGWELSVSGSTAWRERMVGRNALVCLTMIPLLALPVLAALLLALRRFAPANAAAAGAMAGVVSAGAAASLYALHCTDDSALFVALWYGLATLMLAAAGAVAAQRLARW